MYINPFPQEVQRAGSFLNLKTVLLDEVHCSGCQSFNLSLSSICQLAKELSLTKSSSVISKIHYIYIYIYNPKITLYYPF